MSFDDDKNTKNGIEMDPLLKQLEHISNLSVENTSNSVDLNSINFQSQPQEIVLRIDGDNSDKKEQKEEPYNSIYNNNSYLNNSNPYMNPQQSPYHQLSPYTQMPVPTQYNANYAPFNQNQQTNQQPTSTFLSNTLSPAQPKPTPVIQEEKPLEITKYKPEPVVSQQLTTNVIDPIMILNDFKKRMSKGKKIVLWLIFTFIVLCGITFFVFWLIEYLGVTDFFWHPFFDPPAPSK